MHQRLFCYGLIFVLFSFFSVPLSFGGGGESWYSFSEGDPAEPVLEMLEQSIDSMLIRITIPGFYYEDIEGELRIRIPADVARKHRIPGKIIA